VVECSASESRILCDLRINSASTKTRLEYDPIFITFVITSLRKESGHEMPKTDDTIKDRLILRMSEASVGRNTRSWCGLEIRSVVRW